MQINASLWLIKSSPDNTTVDPAVMLSIGALGDYLTMVRDSLYCDAIIPEECRL